MFITKGKSNIKYLLIAIVLATITGGGILIYQYKWLGETPSEMSEVEELETPEVPLPSFLEEATTTDKIKVNFDYAQVATQYLYDPYPSEGIYSDPSTNEELFLVSKYSEYSELEAESSWSVEKGEEKFKPIFRSPNSHNYQGSPVFLNDLDPKFTLSYIGFKVDNPKLIKNFKVEMALDFRMGGEMQITGLSPLDKFLQMLIPPVYACGPADIISMVGESNLTFLQESGGLVWYQLSEPIKLYDFPKWSSDYWHDPSQTIDFLPTLEMLGGGGLRMQIYYSPNNTEGKLNVQVANMIFADENDKYYQPIIEGENNNYLGYLASEEKGFVTLGYNSDTKNLELYFENRGRDAITIDENSLWNIETQSTQWEIKNIALRDLEGNIIHSLSIDDIKNQISGRKIEPNQKTKLTFNSTKDLSKDALYHIIVNTGEESRLNKKDIKDQKRLIQWNFGDNPYYYLYNPNSEIYFYLMYINKNGLVDMDELRGDSRTYFTEGLNLSDFIQQFNFNYWIKTYHPLCKECDSSKQDIFGNLKLGSVQEIINNPQDSVWGLIVPKSEIQSYIKKTDSSLGQEIDYFGTAIEVYRRNGFTGYISYPEGECNVAIIYEIPQEWTDNKELSQYILWTIKTTPVIRSCY